MPVSKHIKKGLTARQWRKRRNLRRAENALNGKYRMRKSMYEMMNQQMLDQAEQKAEAEEKKDD